METDSLGELELEVWRHVADKGGATVADVAREFAQRRGLARTTLLTVMERLRRKRYLTRRRDGGSFRYFSTKPKEQLLRSLVARFADQVLGGSLDPFVAYLVRDAKLNDQQVAELRKLLDALERQKKSRGEQR